MNPKIILRGTIYTPILVMQDPWGIGLTLRLADPHTRNRQEHFVVYELWHDGVPVFRGSNICVPREVPLDDLHCASIVLAYLSTQTHQAHHGYFENYTEYQMKWVKEHGSDLDDWSRHLHKNQPEEFDEQETFGRDPPTYPGLQGDDPI